MALGEDRDVPQGGDLGYLAIPKAQITSGSKVNDSTQTLGEHREEQMVRPPPRMLITL